MTLNVEISESKNVLSYLDSLIDILNGDLVCSIFDIKNAFDFHIVSFPDLPGNIPTASAYGTYTSQLIIYGRTCHSYNNFSSRHSILSERLFNQGGIPHHDFVSLHQSLVPAQNFQKTIGKQ